MAVSYFRKKLLPGIIIFLFLFSYAGLAAEPVWYYSPLSGLPLRDKPNNQPMMVVVENSKAARPQKGLEQATVVYEVLAEGGITRFLALYWETIPDEIGPVRSVREYFLNIALSYDPLLIHSGASPAGFAALAEEEIDNLDEIYNSQYYQRSDTRKAPHNLYTSERLKNYISSFSDKGMQSGFLFNIFCFIGPETVTAEKVRIPYWNNYTVYYTYDYAKNVYTRFVNEPDKPHLVEKGQRIEVDNIIIVFVETAVKDEIGRLDLKLTGEGRALLFNNGRVVEGQWVKEEATAPFRYNNTRGDQLRLKPGITWVQIVPGSSSINWE